MKKLIDLLHYPDIDKGIIRFLIGIYALVWLYRIIVSDSSLILRIFLIIICVFSSVLLFVLARDDIKNGIRKRDLYESQKEYRV